MKFTIFPKFIFLTTLFVVVLSGVTLYVFNHFRVTYYEGHASAQLATAVVGSGGMIEAAAAAGPLEARNALSLFSMFPFALCVEMTLPSGTVHRWPPINCTIIREEKYPLNYPGVFSNGGDLRVWVSHKWIKDQVFGEIKIALVAMGVFLLIFVLGSALLFYRVVGRSVRFLVASVRDVAQDLTNFQEIRKLSRDEIGELTDALNRLFERVRGYQADLLKLAETDSLTGIYNRRKFFEEAEKTYAKHGPQFFMVVADLDFFKQTNDTYGHTIGDQALQLVARLFGASIRTTTGDLVGRLGGEEFGIAITCDDLKTARSTIERVCTSLSESPIKTRSGPISVTASFGLAGGEDVGADSVETLYKFADTACYQAKEAGRNRVCVYEPTLVEGGQEFTRVAPS
ncbi:MAG TPA: sensor domain-containing diguanylate cyclase [Gammaproteobacteria bacterium]|nr:sensor domain-containing diguanylate cyclase [Gammaproteobacteria bacterium]